MSNKIKLRFAVMSDLHYSAEHLHVRDRFKSAINTIYGYCEGEEYKALDAIYVIGDFTDIGLKSEMEMLKEDCDKYIKEGTNLVLTLANHELHYVDDYTESMRNFKEIFKMDFDQHIVMKGYHFISLSTTIFDGPWHDSFDEPKREFLKNALAKAREDGGNKPIFVFQHPGISNTISGGYYGNMELFTALKPYPQVIDFSGHSHFAVNNPGEIDQNYFTSVGTGGLLNLHAREDCAQMLLVEVWEDDTVCIKGLDVISGKFFEDIILREVYDRSKFKYTKQRAMKSTKPYFEKNTKIKTEISGDRITLTFPAAKIDTERVFKYDVCFVDKNKTVISRFDAASDFPKFYQSDTVTISGELPENAVGVKIYAMGFWGNCSESIETQI